MSALRVDLLNQRRHRHPVTASNLFQAVPEDISRATLVVRPPNRIERLTTGDFMLPFPTREEFNHRNSFANSNQPPSHRGLQGRGEARLATRPAPRPRNG